MSLQSQIRETMLKTALQHLLKNQQKSPQRAARNIEELLKLFYNGQAQPICNYTELLHAVKSCSKDDCLEWIMRHIS